VFEYFPENYGWSLSVLTALAMGGELSEIDEACRPLRAVAACGGAEANAAWLAAWSKLGDRLGRLAGEDAERGHALTASRKYLRAATYYLLAERQAGEESRHGLVVYRQGLDAFRRGVELSRRDVQFVDVPFGETALPSLFVKAEGGHEPAPCIVHFNGMDWMKEIVYLAHGVGLADRGVSVLICDHPGVGEALRLRRLAARHDVEVPAAACVDYLESRGDVDPARIGIMAVSLGGYYAPRAAALEKRFACCVAWGAIWDLEYVLEHLRTAGTASVSLDEQLERIFRTHDAAEIAESVRRFTLADVIEELTCPLLVVHGEGDRQVPLWAAERTIEAAINSSRRELKVFRADEGGAEHCQIDNITMGTDFMHDWIADFFASTAAVASAEGRAATLQGEGD